MYLNDFSLRVPEGKELPGGYVELEHDTQYTLSIKNNRSVRARAEVFVDGKSLGVFRLRPNYTLRLERPAHDSGRFTFYELGTSEAKAAQLDDGPDIGLVRVVFTPELKTTVVLPESYDWTWHPTYPWRPQPYWTFDSNVTYSGGTGSANVTQTRSGGSLTSANDGVRVQHSANYVQCGGVSASAGGTGLSGKSDQKFVSVPDLVVDTSQQTTINLRLVCKGDSGPRPLTAFSTPIPPKV